MKRIRGWNALLTGGSRGLGPFIGHALARAGVNLAIAARSLRELEQVARELRSNDVRVEALEADLTVPSERDALVGRAADALGPIDLLVNNAGMEWVSRFSIMPPSVIEQMISLNFAAPAVLTRALLPGMLDRGRGHILTLSSLGGKKGSPYSATYAGTKAALSAWSAGLREELRGTGVGASVVCPGFVSEAGMFAVYRKRAPRIAGESTPDQVATAVLRAIRKDRAEIVVNPGPTRLMFVADAASPRLMSWVLRKAGVYDFYREQAKQNEVQLTEGEPR